MEKSSKILITGGGGLVGTALNECLLAKGFNHILTPSSRELDLLNWTETKKYFLEHKPNYVFHLAARVYGIMGNMNNKGISYLDNVLINTHVIEGARLAGVEKILAMGSGCVYPYPSPGLPLKEDMVWQGPPHPSEDSYAHSKRAMLAQLIAYEEQYNLCWVFGISANLYGPNDKFDDINGHVTPALVKKFYEAKMRGNTVKVWGNGSARRDFMYSSDAAEALYCSMLNGVGAINIASGQVYAIKEIVDELAEITGLQKSIEWDESKPNGQDYRAYDLTKLKKTGFIPKVDLKAGLSNTYSWYEKNVMNSRK
jgi:GDP-L-fucose synthase